MLTSLLEADMLEHEKESDTNYRSMQFEYDHPRIAKVLFKLEVAWYVLMHITICRRGANCDIVMEGYAGPDSGYEDWYCVRCQRGGHHIYY